MAWNGAERSEPDLDRLLDGARRRLPRRVRSGRSPKNSICGPRLHKVEDLASAAMCVPKRSPAMSRTEDLRTLPASTTLAAETVTAVIPEPETAPEAAVEEARVQDQDISPPVAPSSEPEAAAAQPPDDLSAPNDDALQMPPEDAGLAAPQIADGSLSEKPEPVDGWSKALFSRPQPAADDELSDEGRSDATAETIERESVVPATSRPQAVFRDRRGAREGRSLSRTKPSPAAKEDHRSSRARPMPNCV